MFRGSIFVSSLSLSHFSLNATGLRDFIMEEGSVKLPLLSVSATSFEVLEYSEDLSFWTPVARDYGNG